MQDPVNEGSFRPQRTAEFDADSRQNFSFDHDVLQSAAQHQEPTLTENYAIKALTRRLLESVDSYRLGAHPWPGLALANVHHDDISRKDSCNSSVAETSNFLRYEIRFRIQCARRVKFPVFGSCRGAEDRGAPPACHLEGGLNVRPFSVSFDL